MKKPKKTHTTTLTFTMAPDKPSWTIDSSSSNNFSSKAIWDSDQESWELNIDDSCPLCC
ncbi:predicted protein [Arabidopsis lyrata subsp. lyrata]|uniref:Predicted protein n=1 Tax=Arabidopsis lyrata subsp. lyrata TaxID=81972 RepID=D7MTW4_ARALL|nr:predicted protein [Arabidopsis lyrata subsp. lyrata]